MNALVNYFPKISDVSNFGEGLVFRNLQRSKFVGTILTHYTELFFSTFVRNSMSEISGSKIFGNLCKSKRKVLRNKYL